MTQAMDAFEASGGDPQLQQACLAGMARILLHLGDLRSGKALAQQLNSSSLWKECAGILKQMHQSQDAAEMYEQAGMAEKAAGIYIAARNWAAAAPLMARVTSAKLQLQYAKAKESEGSYAEAVAAYEAAGMHAVLCWVLWLPNNTGCMMVTSCRNQEYSSHQQMLGRDIDASNVRHSMKCNSQS